MTSPLIPSEALEALMQKAFLDKTVAAGLFWDALIKTNLYVPLSEDGASEISVEPDQNQEFPMLLGVDSEGNHVIWIFTSPEVMKDYTERELPSLAILAPQLFRRIQNIKREVVLIGPQGLTLRLDPGLVASLAEENVPETLPEEEVRYVPKETSIQVGDPQDYETLQQKFLTLFETLPTVLEASFIQIADDSGSRLLLGLRLHGKSREELRLVTHLIAKAAEGVLEKGRTMDITFLDGSLKEAFEKWGKCFFKR